MRIVAICALLLLASCGGPKEPGKVQPAVHMYGNGDDGSPIVVADGSLHVRSKQEFHLHGTKHASVKRTDFQPENVGFLCDPTPVIGHPTGGCSSQCTAGSTISTACYVAPGNTPWKLEICDSGSTFPCTKNSGGVFQGRILWQLKKDDETTLIKDLERLDVLFYKDFTISNPTPNDESTGVDLSPAPGNHIQATLVVNPGTPVTYNFACKSNADCLYIAYSCYITGNGSCAN